MDAPEYVRCTDTGICEFLDLHCHLAGIEKLDIIKRFSYAKRNNFFAMIEGSINSKELIQNFVIFCIPESLDSFKIACPLSMGQNEDLEKIRHISPFIEKNYNSHNLKLVQISVIRS